MCVQQYAWYLTHDTVAYLIHIVQYVVQLDCGWIRRYIPKNIKITHNDKMFGVSVALQVSSKLVKKFLIRRAICLWWRWAVDENGN